MKKDAIFALIEQEEKRQQETLGLIPSENIASEAVREAVGSVLMHKYAEGQVGKRYYQGNGVADEVEGLCKSRVLEAFELDGEEWGVNVQPHSGSPANLAVYSALLEEGDRILAMYLPDGGHLSHGWETETRKVSIVSKFWKVEHYKTDPETRLLDYDRIEKQAVEFKPRLIVSGGTAYPREIDHKRMKEIAKKVGAYYLADVAHEAGLIIGKAHVSPFPYADVVTMTTHKTLRGPRGAIIVSRKKSEVSEKIDLAVFPGMQGGPHLHSIAGIAVALSEAMTLEFAEYAAGVVSNAKVLAEGLKEKGFDVVSGGTDKHLVLIDLRNRDLSGWVVAWAMEAAGMVANRNTVPGETASPFYPSGLRLGTALVTTRGMGEEEMKMIVDWIDRVVERVQDRQLPKDKEERAEFVRVFMEEIWEDEELAKIRGEVKELCGKFLVS